MKRVVPVLIALVTAVLAPLSAASAASLTPTSSNFVLTGALTVSVFSGSDKYTCNLNNFTGTVKSNGTGTIDNGDFYPDGIANCPYAFSQPWNITATGQDTVTLTNVKLISWSGSQNDCHIFTVQATLVNGVLAFPNTGTSFCSISSSGITLSPTVAAIP